MKNNNHIERYKLCLCYSGGIDSMTALYYAVNELKLSFQDIILIMFDYGQLYFNKEFDLLHKLIDLKKLPLNYKILKINIEDESNLQFHYTLNRNVILSSIAFRFSDEVWIVANADERHVKDKDIDFFTLSTALNSHTIGKPVLLNSPFKNWSRSLIIKWGLANNVPYALSSSCYDKTAMACGMCKGCIDRYFDFMDLNIVEEFHNRILEYPKLKQIIKDLNIKEKTIKEKFLFDKYIRVLNKTEDGRNLLKCIM